jgi:toxin-antitoxin system PIN domain toxin
MTSYLIDINVWLALMWEGHPHTGPAETWLKSIPERRVELLFSRVTQLGLMRLLTNKTIMGDSVLTVGEAVGAIGRWYEDPRVRLAAEPPGIDRVFRTVLAVLANQAATKAIMDAYLVAFAELAGATLVTFDRALAKTGGRRAGRPVLLPHR